MKELLRRAVLEALTEPGDAASAAVVPLVTDEHVSRALDDLLDSAQGVTRALLGVRVGDEDSSEPDDLAAPAAYVRPARMPRNFRRRMQFFS